jgi:HAMP domain-containing protein
MVVSAARKRISKMSSVAGSRDLGKYIRDLRDRAALARRIATEVSIEEAAKSLRKQAQHLEREATELEKKDARSN